jgi:glycosyltransferase involved in cell wall biosynthesis
LTLTPFYPTRSDDASGCFIAEPLVAMAERGVFQTVLAVRPFHRGRVAPSTAAPPADSVRYFSIPGGRGLSIAGAFLFASILGQVRKLHREKPIDVIHAHAPLPCGHAAMLVRRELGIPFLVSVHGLDAYSDVQVQGRPGRWCRRVAQLVYRSAARVICVSEHVRDEVLKGCPSATTSVVYNGVDPKMFAPEAAASTDGAVILSVGNLIPTKGHEVLLRALHAITGSHPAVSCEIVGSGPEETRLKALARHLQIENRVRFLGRLPRRELANAFRRCTLFALPSFFEGLGCVYLEAMATEKVAIGCRGQGIEEIIQPGSNGWLVDPESTHDLARVLSALFSDGRLRSEIAARGRKTILSGLTLAHQAEQLAAIYRETAI